MEQSVTALERYEEVARRSSDIRDHLPLLRRVAAGTILELGVREGNSTLALLAGLEDRGGTLWSVDINPASAQVFEGHAQWRFVLADSCDAGALERAGLPGRLDVLFIDTIHTYEQVRQELETWGDRVKAGGLLLFHDTDAFPEIRLAIAGWCRPRGVPYQFRGRSNGLGIAYPGAGRLLGARLWLARGVRRVAASVGRSLRWLMRAPRRVLRRLRREFAERLA